LQSRLDLGPEKNIIDYSLKTTYGEITVGSKISVFHIRFEYHPTYLTIWKPGSEICYIIAAINTSAVEMEKSLLLTTVTGIPLSG